MSAIKPEDYISVTETGTAHIPKTIREGLGTKKIPYVMGAKIVVLYDPNATLEDVIKSMNVLTVEIQLRKRGNKT